ncbi:MAG: threonine-phosphate decarboxylase, partial [Mesorhizobium sp.]
VRLDALFGRFGVPVAGGTTLFRYLSLPDAGDLFSALGESGILLRHFSDRPHVLRAGLPGSEEEWRRLESALADWASRREDRSKGSKP